jgi:hypothetical protein
MGLFETKPSTSMLGYGLSYIYSSIFNPFSITFYIIDRYSPQEHLFNSMIGINYYSLPRHLVNIILFDAIKLIKFRNLFIHCSTLPSVSVLCLVKSQLRTKKLQK